MKGVLHILKTTGDILRREVERPDVTALKAGIGGGPIETVPYFDTFRGEPCVAYCDEEGKMKGYPVNIVANRFWFDQTPEMAEHDVLVGDIVVVQGDEEFMAAL